jgi:alkanesulfonate monooxygenase SsuD/methylene tetrahydromethanopterin reductase-like flavin-dependent oxidoreductase (luciferase family)
VSNIPLSVLDLASISAGDSVGQSLQNCVSLAQRAEQLGFTRVWYAEHHNFESIASSATSVLIAHVAANTKTIRLGSGGVMLPNHSPLVIAEQFGTLASLHPGRIDLGLGRAPGTDQVTMRAMRRDPRAAENFADDIVELQAFLSDTSRVTGVKAMPGQGTHVPLYILGSSRVYRERFTPSAQLSEPYTMASFNVIAADTQESALRQKELRRRNFTRALFSRQGQSLTDDEVAEVLNTPQGAHVDQMFTYAAVGTTDVVKAGIEEFAALTQANEIITAHHCESGNARIRSIELLAEATHLAPREPALL